MDRSEGYKRIAERVTEQFTVAPEEANESIWWRRYAPKWRNRVGLPRLIADEAMGEALGLLRSINRGIFRDDPAMREQYDTALWALSDLAGEFARENWRSFEGSKTDDHS